MVRKFFAALLMALMFASCAWASYYDEGHQGLSESDAYIIDAYEDLYTLTLRVNSGNEPAGRYYRLTNNITINADSWSPIGGDSSSTFFTGHFNGDGNTITTTRVIFGIVNTTGTAVTNLHVNGDINLIGHFYGSAYALSDSTAFISEGGIAAFLLSGTIEYCDFEGTITKEETLDHATAGGIVGYMKDGTIKNCTVNGKITAGISGNKINYFGYAGGIVGYMKGGKIQDCTVNSGSEIKAYSQGSEGTESCESYAGGIVGYANGESVSITGNKTTATINSKQYAGGIMGFMSGGTLQDNKVLTGTQINANYTAGGITGQFGGTGYCQSNDIAMDSLIYVVNQAAGGIVGSLASGTVRYNKADTQVSGSAKYNGKIIGEITGLNYSIYDNTYGASNTTEYLIGYDKKTSGPSNNNNKEEGEQESEPNSGDDANNNTNNNNNSNENTNENNNINNNANNNENSNSNDNTTNVNVNVEVNKENEESGGLIGTVAKAATGGGGGCNAGFSLGIFAALLILRRK